LRSVNRIDRDMTSKSVEYVTEAYRNSPDREVLTPEGCQALLQVGEKTLREYRREAIPIPSTYTANSYRYPRRLVLQWFDERCLKEAQPLD
jgi:hypothetical protein